MLTRNLFPPGRSSGIGVKGNIKSLNQRVVASSPSRNEESDEKDRHINKENEGAGTTQYTDLGPVHSPHVHIIARDCGRGGMMSKQGQKLVHCHGS